MPATDAVMGSLSEARVGIGSAMNTVGRLVAGSIGVATIGSALSTVYSSSFEKAVAAIPGLPEEITRAASDSVGVAVTVAQQLPAGLADALVGIAKESFMDGWLASNSICYLWYQRYWSRYYPEVHATKT